MNKQNELLRYLFLLVVLFFVEIIFSILYESTSIHGFRLPLSMPLVVFLSYRASLRKFPWYLLGVEFIHSFFTLDGFGIGVLIGLLLFLCIFFGKDYINSSHRLFSVVFVFVGYHLWFLGSMLIKAFKFKEIPSGSLSYGHFLFMAILISLASPFIFKGFNQVWTKQKVND